MQLHAIVSIRGICKECIESLLLVENRGSSKINKGIKSIVSELNTLKDVSYNFLTEEIFFQKLNLEFMLFQFLKLASYF